MGKGFEIKGSADKNDIKIGDNPIFKGKNSFNFRGNSSNNTISIGDKFVCNNLKIGFFGKNNQLIIGNNVDWVGQILIVGKNRKVEIGGNTSAKGVYILSREANVSIGENCLLSRDIEIRSTDVHKIYDLNTGERLNPPGYTKVSDNVWIAAGAKISKGVTIPSGSVVGANSFVNRSFNQENTIIAGSPAKVVKENVRWER